MNFSKRQTSTSGFRKRKREEQQDDYSGGIEAEMSKFSKSSNKKHTLDSDDDDEDDAAYNKKKYDVLSVDDIDGQEEGTVEFDGETRFTPFNLKDEMEDGYFDANGMYVWNKNEEIKDNWLDSVDRIKIKDRKSIIRNENEEESQMSESEKTATTLTLYGELLSYLNPGENTLQAIKRIGGGKQLTASEKLKQKKLARAKNTSTNEDKKVSVAGSSKVGSESQEKVTKVTEIVNKILGLTGNMDIYEESREVIFHKLSVRQDMKEDDGQDMFSDEFSTEAKIDV